MTEIIIDEARALELCGGYPEVLQEVRQAFQIEAQELRRELTQYYGQQDWEKLHVKAHSLKNAAASVGAVTLSEAARDMEYALRDARLEEAKAMYGPMMECMEQSYNKMFTKENE